MTCIFNNILAALLNHDVQKCHDADVENNVYDLLTHCHDVEKHHE
jgi:hypothetical protein